MKRHFSVQVGDFAYTWWLDAAIVDADGNVIVEDTFQFDTDGEDADTPLTEMEAYAEAELRKRIQTGETQKWVAYIKVYCSGRPSYTCVCPGSSLEEADPMAAHDGAVVVGVYDSPTEANDALERYWSENVEVDEDGYSQWK